MNYTVSHNVHSEYYNEEYALQELIDLIESVEYEKDLIEHKCCYSTEQISITLNGRTVAFSFKDKNIEALFSFIGFIAKEKGYKLNI